MIGMKNSHDHTFFGVLTSPRADVKASTAMLSIYPIADKRETGNAPDRSYLLSYEEMKEFRDVLDQAITHCEWESEEIQKKDSDV